MIEDLISHIGKYIPVSDKLKERLDDIAKPLALKKGEFLHKPGKVCNTTYYICSGLVRNFYQRNDKEITDTFSAEGEWITSVYSFFKNVPDHFYIQTLEPSTLLGIRLDHLEQCFRDFAEMERFGRMLMSQYFLEQSERLISMQFHSAPERYQFFFETSRNKIQRVPLGMLASHLGMTQETLSRIRSGKIVS